ncbi:MAG: hypothetical protein KC933_41535 [Myxococcales bacterium]|nr:hypothetical protein [Myxococcales bacterium]
MVTLPGSRVSLWVPTRAQRVGRGFQLRFDRAGAVEVRVAESSIGPRGIPDLEAGLAGQAGIAPGTELVEDPPGSGHWHTPLEQPRQAWVWQLRSGTAAAAVMVGIESRADLDVAERILASATLDPTLDYDAARLMGIEVGVPVGTQRVPMVGPALVAESTDPALFGGMTVAWIPAGVEVSDAFLEESLRDLLSETQVTDAELERAERGGLRGHQGRGTAPDGMEHLFATMAVPGETDGLFMVHASARGEGAEALMRVMVATAKDLRIVDRAELVAVP